MSGKPSTGGAKHLRALLRENGEITQSIEILRSEITERKKSLETLLEKERKTREEAVKLMDNMDVSSPGNFGHESRIFWLLREISLTED
jgi:hypothetical protein